MPENVSTLIGVLLDVSDSMRSNIGDGIEEEGGDWVRSIFHVIDNLIKHDVSASNHVFAIGFGASSGKGVFDIIHTLERCQHHDTNPRDYEDTVERILQILEKGGAPSVRKWANLSVIRPVISHIAATIILHELETNEGFVTKFVNEYLPKECKGIIERRPRNYVMTAAATCAVLGPLGLLATPFVLEAANAASEQVATTVRPATEEDVKLVAKKAFTFFMKNVVFPSSIYGIHEASKILRGCDDEEDTLTEKRVKELKDTVKPVIYGRTPFFTSLDLALELFRYQKYQDHKKLLFVLSDGMPTDYIPINALLSRLRDSDVTIVGCYITKSSRVEPYRLFSEANDSWENGAKLLFGLSSKITTQLLPRTIFIKRGWKIDITNNETKLFLQANNPDIMKDACSLARDVVCCQDALADALVTVDLDIYINQSTSEFGAPQQVGGTCYANASAAVLHLSMKRILGREGGYPDFGKLRKDLIARFGDSGENTFGVLRSVCPQYRLRCEEISTKDKEVSTQDQAMAAIIAKRPVVAKFRLSEDEWKTFKTFYKNNSTGILTCKELDISKRRPKVKTRGHAVVLTSYNSKCLILMNSWGTEWGDKGFFRVQNAEVLGLKFIDVFWKEEDLTEDEKKYYKKHGAEVANKLIDRLKGLQSSTYQCPRCSETSKVTEYSGRLTCAKCPKCNQVFDTKGEGNILALNMYLTVLSR